MKRMMIVFLLTAALLTAGLSNPGTRHESASALSAQAEAYYTGAYAPETLLALAGPVSQEEAAVWACPLRTALSALTRDRITGLVSYSKTLSCFSNTDISGGSTEPLRFYCDDFGSYNREQLWAELHGSFYQDEAGRDLHHLRPADPEANLIRSTMCFGCVRERLPACQSWPETGEPVFWYDPGWNNQQGLAEVRDEIKGDVARILLYVYVCWGQEDGGNRNLWTDLPQTGSGLLYSDGLRVMEDPDTLLSWMALDPVDSWELGRNDAVEAIQGNRNPFIDYPELAFSLLGQPIPDMPTPSGLAHDRYCTLSALALPSEGGSVSVSGHTVRAVPASGWVLSGWSLEPEEAAAVTQSGNLFTLSPLRQSCTLSVSFRLENPCALGHSWDGGSVTRQPGCESAGERCFRCQVCGETRTEPIPPVGHDWHTQTVPPGCTKAGYTLNACWRCGVELETPGDPPLGHDWDAGTVIRQPTRTQPGERRFRCPRCGLTRSEEIPFRFVDVSDPTAYYFQPVYWALLHQPPITSGTDGTHFSPNASCSRAEAMTFLWRAVGCPAPQSAQMPFLDVPANAYYRKPVLWAVEQGICSGTSADSFSPRLACTRAQVLSFLWHALGNPEPELTELPFTDVPQSAYYWKPVCWAYGGGIVAGSSSDSFSPNALCTRAQIVTILWRVLGP